MDKLITLQRIYIYISLSLSLSLMFQGGGGDFLYFLLADARSGEKALPSRTFGLGKVLSEERKSITSRFLLRIARGRQADRQTDKTDKTRQDKTRPDQTRQTDRQTDRQTHTHTHT